MERHFVKPALAGALASVSALAVGEFVASFFAPRPGPVIAVANRVVDLAPVWFVEFGKSVFGLADKPAVIVGTVLLTIIFGALCGVASTKNVSVGYTVIGLFGLLGFFSIWADAQSGIWFALFCLFITAGTGILVLRFLLRKIYSFKKLEESGSESLAEISDRRGFLTWAAAVGVGSVLLAFGGKALRSLSVAARFRQDVVLPKPDAGGDIDAKVTAAEGSSAATVSGISPLVVPNDDFYRIDTSLITPQVDPQDWKLEITGMVGNPFSLSYEQLLERATTVAPVTLSCVSNEVGGEFVGNAVWQGVPLRDLLEEAELDPAASQIASRSVDGWTCGFPTDTVFDGRAALVAVGMNGEPLPIVNGFPARLVVSGLYGYVSATKWLTEIEATTWDGFDGYWVPRGWAKEGPVKTQSRIDVPRNQSTIEAGKVAIAGVAWAPNTGVESVEIRVDEDPWVAAELGKKLGKDSWVQWVVSWNAEPGEHTLQVRATDASGETQTSEVTPPRPNGAAGWHTIRVQVV